MCRRGTWSPQACHPEFPRSHPSPFTSIPRPMIVIPRPIIVIPCPSVVIPSEAEGSETSVPQPLQSPPPASGHPIPRRTGDTRYPRWGTGRAGHPLLPTTPTDRRPPHPRHTGVTRHLLPLFVFPDPDRGPPQKLPLLERVGVRANQPRTELPDLIRYPRWGTGRAGHPLPKLPDRQPTLAFVVPGTPGTHGAWDGARQHHHARRTLIGDLPPKPPLPQPIPRPSPTCRT